MTARPIPAPIAQISDAEFSASLARFRKPLRVYVAGRSAEIDRCERVIAAVRADGNVITHDWTVQMRAAMASGRRDSDFAADELRPFLAEDLDGVDAADVLLVLLPEYGSASSGMSVELGAGITRKRRGETLRIVASRGINTPIADEQKPHEPANGWARCFADVVLYSDDAAVAWLRGSR